MKAGIHPVVNHVVFVDSASGTEFPTTSTLKSDKTKKINGVDYFVINVDISSATHPFYTGKQTLIDTAGRVDKFRARMEAGKQKQELAVAAKQKKEIKAKETVEEKVTRKAKENTERKEAEKVEVKKTAKKATTTKVEKEGAADKKPKKATKSK